MYPYWQCFLDMDRACPSALCRHTAHARNGTQRMWHVRASTTWLICLPMKRMRALPKACRPETNNDDTRRRGVNGGPRLLQFQQTTAPVMLPVSQEPFTAVCRVFHRAN